MEQTLIFPIHSDDLTTKWAIDEKKFRSEVGYIYDVPLFWTDLSVSHEFAFGDIDRKERAFPKSEYDRIQRIWI